MLKHNQALLKEFENKKPRLRNRIDWSTLDKRRDYFLLLNERKLSHKLTYAEKSLQTMFKGSKKNRIKEILEFNIKYYENEFQMTAIDIESDSKDKDPKLSRESSQYSYFSEYSDSDMSS